jgi:hypothetical protein
MKSGSKNLFSPRELLVKIDVSSAVGVGAKAQERRPLTAGPAAALLVAVGEVKPPLRIEFTQATS